jgi:hypothetical protein
MLRDNFLNRRSKYTRGHSFAPPGKEQLRADRPRLLEWSFSYIKERFHEGYITTGLDEGWISAQTAFAEKDPVAKFF